VARLSCDGVSPAPLRVWVACVYASLAAATGRALLHTGTRSETRLRWVEPLTPGAPLLPRAIGSKRAYRAFDPARRPHHVCFLATDVAGQTSRCPPTSATGCVALRHKGWTLRKIAPHLNMSKSGAASSVQRIAEGRPGNDPRA